MSCTSTLLGTTPSTFPRNLQTGSMTAYLSSSPNPAQSFHTGCIASFFAAARKISRMHTPLLRTRAIDHGASGILRKASASTNQQRPRLSLCCFVVYRLKGGVSLGWCAPSVVRDPAVVWAGHRTLPEQLRCSSQWPAVSRTRWSGEGGRTYRDADALRKLRAHGLVRLFHGGCLEFRAMEQLG